MASTRFNLTRLSNLLGFPDIRRLTITTLLVAFVPVHLAIADLDRGLQAYQAGDYEKAYDQWKAAANAGDEQAQYRLGTLYEDGVGTTQNLVQAHRWYMIAAAAGVEIATDSQVSTEQRLSAAELAEATRLAESFTVSALPQDSEHSSRDGTAASSSTAPTQDRASDYTNLVREVQTELTRLGYSVGAADGILGDRTRFAVVAAQTNLGINVDGQINEEFVARLKTLDAAAHRDQISNASVSNSGSAPETSTTDTQSVVASNTQSRSSRQSDETTIAIFPLVSEADDKFYGLTLCEEVIAGTRDRDFKSFRVTHASVPCEVGELAAPAGLDVLGEVDHKLIWKKSLFSGAKPDLDTVAEYGRKLGVDLVVLFNIKEPLAWENPGAVELLVQREFVVDTREGLQWSEAGQPGHSIQGSMRSEIPRISKALWNKYRNYSEKNNL